MTLAATRLTLKQHRAEVGLATTAALLVASVALWVAVASPSTRQEAGSFIVGAMKVLPFGIGLVAGIPVVSREYEDRTAQIAWSLHASRMRWLLRQLLPILIVVGVATAVAAFAVTPAISHRWASAEQEYFDIGTHGLPAIARAFGAFGIGLFVGALVRRALPALVLAAAICLALFTIVGSARDVWLSQQGPLIQVGDSTSAVQTTWDILAPDGRQLSIEQAQLVVPEVEPDWSAWLENHGYSWLALGVARVIATRWAWYDALAFAAIGVAAIGGTAVLVNRSRPD
jgi:hypothetical protein